MTADGFSEFYFLKDYFEVLGLPHLEASDYADCSIIGLNAECTTQQFLQGMRDGSYYVAPPYARPVYSNAAFRIISHALEAATGKNYSVLIRELVTGPLGMTNTLATTPPNGDEGAVIPPVENNWGGDYGANVP